jgi:hypothetical protein
MVGSGSVLMDQVASTDMLCHLDLSSRRLEIQSHCLSITLCQKFYITFQYYVSGTLLLPQNSFYQVKSVLISYSVIIIYFFLLLVV